MPVVVLVLASGQNLRVQWCDGTYELRLFHHGRKHELRASDALVECAPMQLPRLSILLCHSMVIDCSFNPSMHRLGCLGRHDRKLSPRQSDRFRGGECAPKRPEQKRAYDAGVIVHCVMRGTARPASLFLNYPRQGCSHGEMAGRKNGMHNSTDVSQSESGKAPNMLSARRVDRKSDTFMVHGYNTPCHSLACSLIVRLPRVVLL